MENKEKHTPASEEQMNNSESVNQNINDNTEAVIESTDNNVVKETDTENTENAVSEDQRNTDTGGEIVSTVNFSMMNKTELVSELRNLIENKAIETIGRDVEIIKGLFYKIRKEEIETLEAQHTESGNESPFIVPEDKQENEFRSLLARNKELRENYLNKIETEKEENYKLKLQVIEDIKNLTSEEEDLNTTFRKFRDLQTHWREIGQVPQPQIKALWETYHHNVEVFYDYVKINKELRDLDLKKNLEAKEDLCAKAEALVDNEQIIEAFLQLQKYHEQWREIGPVHHESRESVWERFKEATSKINKRHQEYFELRKEEFKKNLDEKIALCEKVEQLAELNSTSPKEWLKYSEELTAMMDAWKQVGFIPRKDSNKVYERFKVARDKFFTTRRDFYKNFRQDMQNNLQQKRELCEQAETFMNSDDWKKATDELIALQRKWKEVGIVPRKNSDELWKRFRAACDTFFNRKAEHFSEIDTHYEDNLKAKEALIIEIDSFAPSDAAAADFELLKAFQQRWNQIGFVPLKEKERITKQYQEAIDKQFKLLKVSDSEKKVMKYRSKIENIQDSQDDRKVSRVLRNEREKLFYKIVQLQNDITLWENNIGFFAKSKNADAMIADVNRKIENARNEIIVLEEKIKLIDQQYE